MSIPIIDFLFLTFAKNFLIHQMESMQETISHEGLMFHLDFEKKTACVVGNDNTDQEICIPISIRYDKVDFTIKSINKGAFQNSPTIRSIIFPENSKVAVFEKDAFANSEIENLVIPSSVTDMHDGWCKGTPKLIQIRIMPGNEKYIYLDDKIILGKAEKSSNDYINLVFARRDIKNVQIPSFINQISSYAFSESALEKIHISSQIRQISEGAFYRCQKLEYVEISPNSVLKTIESLSFANCPINEIALPSTVLQLGDMWCSETTNITKLPPVNEAQNLENASDHADVSVLSHAKSSTSLFYQKKNTQFSRTILKSVHQFNKIEILPKDKNCFSLTDFIIFASAVYPKFISSKPRKSTSKGIYLVLTAIPNDEKVNSSFKQHFKDEHYSIKVEIDKDFNDIHVFVKDNLNYFDVIENMIMFNSKIIDYEIFDRIVPRNEPGSMLFQFGQYVSNSHVQCPVFLKYTFAKFQHVRTQRYKSKFCQTDNILKMLKNVPGKVFFRYQKTGTGGYSFKNKSGTQMTVNSFAWLLPWAEEVIAKIHYMQIDGSFRAFPEYAFCIWHGIFYNQSIPFALTVFPTEQFQLYNILIDCINFYKIDVNLFKGRIVLSDMGSAIEQFCKVYNLSRFICHRHIIESFGSRSPLGIIVVKLLKTKNEIEYHQFCEEISGEIKMYEKLKEQFNRNDEITQNKIRNLKIMISGFDGDPNSNYHVCKWAQWIRADYHVGRCSNHSEGAHGNINDSIERRGSSNFSSGLSATISYILNYLQNRKANYISPFSKRYSNIKKNIINILSTSDKSKIKKYYEICQCQDEFYNKSIHGVDFTCTHKILKSIYSSEELNEFKNANSIDIEKFIIHFLQLKINFSHKHEDKEIAKKCKEIIEYYDLKEKKKLELKSTSVFINLLFSIFSYQLPDPLEFNENCDKNELHIEESSPIEIKKKKTSKPILKVKVKNDDLTFWLRNCSNNIQMTLKTRYYETVNEIFFIYEKIGDRAFSICNDNFEKYLSEIYSTSAEIIESKQDIQFPNILARIAEFKINCWLNADQIMNDHKFI